MLRMTVLMFLSLNLLWAQNNYPFSKGEDLQYEIRWGLVPAGTAILRTDRNQSGNGYRLMALAKSKGYYEWAYRVRDTVVTWIQEDLRPTAFSKVLHEGGWHNHQVVAFHGNKAILTDSVFNSAPPDAELKRSSSAQVEIEGLTHTVTSAFYAFRTVDLIKDKQYEFQAVSGKKKYKLKVVVHGYETIETPAGKFDCAIVEPMLDGDGIFNAKGKMWIWISRDSRRLPVKVKSEISLGSISIELVHWKQG